jgi:hypothetical protein
MKSIKITVCSTPVMPKYGYADHFVMSESDGSILDSGHCSTCPNPFKPKSLTPWAQAYGWVAPGEYNWTCVEHPKYKKCLLINGGEAILSRIKNSNHKNQFIISEVFWHVGGFGSKNPEWRGSSGCLTSHKEEFDKMISFITTGERGTLTIRDYLQGDGMPTKKEVAEAKVDAVLENACPGLGLNQAAKTDLIMAAKNIPPEFDPLINMKKGIDGATLGGISTAVGYAAYEFLIKAMEGMPGDTEKAVAAIAGCLLASMTAAAIKMIVNKMKITKANE